MNQYPKRRNNITTTALPDGYVVLVNQDTNWAHTITPLSGLVWEYCDGLHEESDILKELKSIAELADSKDLEDQVKAILAKLNEDGFFEDADGTA